MSERKKVYEDQEVVVSIESIELCHRGKIKLVTFVFCEYKQDKARLTVNRLTKRGIPDVYSAGTVNVIVGNSASATIRER